MVGGVVLNGPFLKNLSFGGFVFKYHFSFLLLGLFSVGFGDFDDFLTSFDNFWVVIVGLWDGDFKSPKKVGMGSVGVIGWFFGIFIFFGVFG